MKNVLKDLENNPPLFVLFEQLHTDTTSADIELLIENSSINFQNKNLNSSQQTAVRTNVQNEDLVIVHGSPGHRDYI